MSEFSQDWFKAALWVTWVLADNLIDRPEPVAELSDGIRKLCELDFPSRTLLATGAKCGYCPRRRRIWIKPEHLTSQTSLDPILLTRINPRRKTPSFRTRIKRLCLDHTLVDRWRLKTLGQVLDEWNETDDTLKRIKTGLNRLQSAHILDLRFPGVLVLGRQRTSGKQEGCLSLGFRFEREIARLESLAEGFRVLEQPEPLAGFESAEGRVPRLLSQPMDAEVPIDSPFYREQSPPKSTSETKEVALQQFMAQKRQFVREACSFRFRRQLCLPLRDADIVDLLPSKDLRSEEIPRLFSYVPHTLTYATVPPGQTAEAASFAEVDFEGVVQAIAHTRERLVVLVEAKAGFGKTTFMYRLAHKLACRGGGALPLLPVRVFEKGRSESPVNWSELLTLGVRDLKQLSGDEIRREDVESMMNDGHAVAFVDGLDQLPDGAGMLVRGLPPATKPIKVVASCRQEAHAIADHGWTHVLRLGAPSEEDFSQNVPKEHQNHLEACLGDDDPRNPFMLHIVRVLDCRKDPLPPLGGVTELLDSYLAFLFAWAEAKLTGRDVKERPEGLTREQRLALGVLGLTSLRYRPRGAATEQRIDKEAFDVARDLARQLAVDADWSSQAVDKVFDYSREHADLVYIARETFLRKQKTFLFHHQLLQEYLAALGTVDELGREIGGSGIGDRGVAALQCVARIFGEVIRPRPTRAPASPSPGVEAIEHRVHSLRYVEFVARLLGQTESPIQAEIRASLLKLIPVAILEGRVCKHAALDQCVSAMLLRLRDEMVAHDKGLIAWAEETAGRAAEGERLRLSKAKLEGRPDTFVILSEPDEIAQIEALQPGDDELKEMEQRMREQEPVRGWTVESIDHLVVATTGDGERWFLVPPGRFVAGGTRSWSELPVRAEETRAFLIAERPVSNGQFEEFVGSGYADDLGDECWTPFRDEARAALFGRSEPPCWEKRSHIDHSVGGVSWFEAAAYCRWLSRKHGGAGASGRYRLPSEGEWEKAARGLFGRTWPWGCLWKEDLVWASNLSPSPFGIRETTAGLPEWTRSSWKEQGFGEEVSVVSMTGGISARGGVTNHGGVRWCAFRFRAEAWGLTTLLGFRCVREVDESG
ncbi:MAG TPA: SUMF1/EgtB/PvdO family nonheme iron enzyme [Thermoanaerobaculales bacterium]|nr:SUMF1/EgtB/PvdO family nonheme iron enzyme [Thermoanaerobaculales bacterium]